MANVLPILTLILLVPGVIFGALLVRGRKLYLIASFRNLVQAKRRTLLLGSALGFVALLFLLLLSLLQGITNNMERAATILVSGHINLGGWYKQTPTDMAPVALEAAKLRRLVEQHTPGVDYIIDRHFGFGKVVSDTSSVITAFNGIDPAQEQNLTSVLVLARRNTYDSKAGPEDESRPGDLKQVGQPGTITLFASQAKRLGVVIGDNVTLTGDSIKGATNSAQVTVVAICEDIGILTSFNVFMHRETVRELYQFAEDSTGAIMVYLKDIRQASAVMAKLRGVLEKEGVPLMEHDPSPFFEKFEKVLQDDWVGPKIDLTVWEDEVSFLVKIITALEMVGSVMMLVLLFVVVLGIVNTMWIAVRERTQEIGTLRAVGMTQSRVMMLLLAEALLLGLGATAAGSTLGGLIGFTIELLKVRVPFDAMQMVLLSDTFHFALRPLQFASTIVVLTSITMLGAMWPAIRAARLQPVTAMQHVD
jgi:putative ABC transport system permease protein